MFCHLIDLRRRFIFYCLFNWEKQTGRFNCSKAMTRIACLRLKNVDQNSALENGLDLERKISELLY